MISKRKLQQQKPEEKNTKRRKLSSEDVADTSNSIQFTTSKRKLQQQQKLRESKRRKTSDESTDNSIQFISSINSTEEPLFSTYNYCIQHTSSKNTLLLEISDLNKYLQLGKDFYICQTHGLQDVANINCHYCINFNNFTYTYILKTKYHCFTFPPPNWYSPKVLNFLKTFCFNSNKFIVANTDMKEAEKHEELNSYSQFVSMGFTEGNLRSLSTGKTSYLRNKILGFHTNGGRATLSIDSTLLPQYVILPQQLFDSLDLVCPLILINRAPSLKNTCLYAVEALRSENPTDYTIRINSYLCEGLHADQDGDELSIFYIKNPGTTSPSYDIQIAICELKNFSWNGNIRHDFAYEPRYEFTQYLKYILYCSNVRVLDLFIYFL